MRIAARLGHGVALVACRRPVRRSRPEPQRAPRGGDEMVELRVRCSASASPVRPTTALHSMDSSGDVDELELRGRAGAPGGAPPARHRAGQPCRHGRARCRKGEVVLVVERRLRQRSEARCDAGDSVAAPAEQAPTAPAPGPMPRARRASRRRRARCSPPDDRGERRRSDASTCRTSAAFTASSRGVRPARQHSGTEQLGQPVEHEEPHIEQTVAATPELATPTLSP